MGGAFGGGVGRRGRGWSWQAGPSGSGAWRYTADGNLGTGPDRQSRAHRRGNAPSPHTAGRGAGTGPSLIAGPGLCRRRLGTGRRRRRPRMSSKGWGEVCTRPSVWKVPEAAGSEASRRPYPRPGGPFTHLDWELVEHLELGAAGLVGAGRRGRLRTRAARQGGRSSSPCRAPPARRSTSVAQRLRAGCASGVRAGATVLDASLGLAAALRPRAPG